MPRWISELPPAIVAGTLDMYCSVNQPFICAYGSPLRSAPNDPITLIPKRAKRWLSSELNILAMLASWFGASPPCCIESTRSESIRETSMLIATSATPFCSRFSGVPGRSCSQPMKSSKFRRSAAEPLSAERSKSIVAIPTYQPRFSSPTRFCTGTRTSSKKTSLKPCPPSMLISGRTVMPGVFMSTSR